jgi:hypothetical protein
VVIAVAAVALLVGATPDAATRHPVVGRYNVPSFYVQLPATTDVGNVITNSSFESGNVDGGWFQCGDGNAYVTREHPYNGVYDEYSGTPNGAGEPAGNSGVCQQVLIPPGGMLTAWLYQVSNEPDSTFAYQEADLLDDRGDVVLNLYKAVNDKAGWRLGRWNLAAYAGRRLWLYFGVHGDGFAKTSTQQFLDDVILTGTRPSGSK